jgi:hypothetical protein
MLKQKLILEGLNDVHVISNLLTIKKIEIRGYEEVYAYKNQFIGMEKNDDGKVREGKKEALSRLEVAIRSESFDRIGLIVDADFKSNKPALSTWQSISAILSRNGYVNLPQSPNIYGSIIEQEDLPQIGVWIMPDNQNAGYLEHFFEQMIQPNDPFLQEATAITEGYITSKRNRFSETNLQKAKIKTWLAWQREPDKPMGYTLQEYKNETVYNFETPLVERFLNWFKATFDTYETT